jgi:hypothetical protein
VLGRASLALALFFAKSKKQKKNVACMVQIHEVAK